MIAINANSHHATLPCRRPSSTLPEAQLDPADGRQLDATVHGSYVPKFHTNPSGSAHVYPRPP